jgi:hypothetical protein
MKNKPNDSYYAVACQMGQVDDWANGRCCVLFHPQGYATMPTLWSF